MGRVTSGWLLGVRVTEAMGPVDADGDLRLLETWAKANHERGVARQREMEAEVAAGTRQRRDVRPRDEIVPVQPRLQDGADLIGFWVAVGGSGKPGVPGLGTSVAVDELATTEPYAAPYARAQERWQAFALWAQGRGVPLPPVRLWLTETEVA